MKALVPLVGGPPTQTQTEMIRSDQGGGRNAALRKAAIDLEAAFLAEMLKSAGFGKSRDSNGGGAGEDQFSSLLIQAQAKQMTLAGGIGLAESLFNALLEAENDAPKRPRSD